MYFTEIIEIDERWHQDDEPCLNFFHKVKTCRLFSNFIQETGQLKYD